MVAKMVVACKDFTSPGYVLKQFSELKNSQIQTSKNGYKTELSEVIDAIESQEIVDVTLLKQFFGDLVIVDAFIGNFDRHNGNWGFLINEHLQNVNIAPIYDCASLLYPQLNDQKMAEIINNEDELNERIYTFPMLL